MSIQTTSGNVEVTASDAVFTIRGTQFVVKVRLYDALGYMLVIGQNHGSGWDEGVFAMNDPLPATGDAKAILTAALPMINKIIGSASTPGPVAAADLPHQVDAAIQTLRVVNNQLSF